MGLGQWGHLCHGVTGLPDGAGSGEDGWGELVPPSLQGGQGAITDQAVQEGAAPQGVGLAVRVLQLEVCLEGGERLLGGWRNRGRAGEGEVKYTGSNFQGGHGQGL